MTNDVLERLRNDHVRFDRFFRAIEGQCERLEAGQQADLPRLRAITAYLSKHAFPRHHASEEAIFALLIQRLPRLRADVFDLTADHRASEQEFRTFARAVDVGNGGLAENARSFIANERGHFISEEEIVFRYASTYLSAEQWSVLRNSMATECDNGKPADLELIADLVP